MSILATRRPIRDRRKSDRRCYRCGIEWEDSHDNWPVFESPCGACRIMLKREGVDLSEFKIRPAA